MKIIRQVTVPILNHEYKIVVCWGDKKHLRDVLLDHHYNPDYVTKTYISDQTSETRGATFREHRCYPVVWINADLPAPDAIGTLAHEAVHAVEFIFEALDETLNHSEIFAHSVGAVVREALRKMNLLSTKDKEKNK